MISFNFGTCHFDVYPEEKRCTTVFCDGSKVEACPEDTDQYRKTAADLGYSDTWEMCWQHELFHTMLAMIEGRALSPTLWAVAHGSESELCPNMIALEEAAVLDFQRRFKAAAPVLQPI